MIDELGQCSSEYWDCSLNAEGVLNGLKIWFDERGLELNATVKWGGLSYLIDGFIINKETKMAMRFCESAHHYKDIRNIHHLSQYIKELGLK